MLGSNLVPLLVVMSMLTLPRRTRPTLQESGR